jgi:serine/threonine-protein kinase
MGAASFSRVVAIKRLHAHLAREHEFLTMFLDEARLTARVRHPNVAATLDVVTTDREVFIVMDYVHGESLSKLFAAMRARREPMPLPVAAAIVVGMLDGLHAAHEATDERGIALQVVHRDVSPQNVMVGCDGVARMVDFGIAKAAGRLQRTATGEIKGKFGYMAPEQVNGARVTRATDIYAAGVVLWEALTGAVLFRADSDVQLAAQVLLNQITPPSHLVQGIPIVFDDIVMCALDRDPSRRFATARDMARAIETSLPVANASEVAAWMQDLAGPVIRRREERLAEIEHDWALRTGIPRRSDAPSVPTPAGTTTAASRDASTRAVSLTADSPDSTRIEGRRRAGGIVDTVDSVARRRASLAVWAAIGVAGVLFLGAALDRRDDVHGWFVRATAASGSPSALASMPAADPASKAPLRSAPIPAAPPRATTLSVPAPPSSAPSATPVASAAPQVATVPVDSLPVVVPPSVSFDSLPRPEEDTETASPPAPARAPRAHHGHR